MPRSLFVYVSCIVDASLLESEGTSPVPCPHRMRGSRTHGPSGSWVTRRSVMQIGGTTGRSEEHTSNSSHSGESRMPSSA